MGASGARMIPTRYNKHMIVSILYVLIEHETWDQITPTYPEADAVPAALSLAQFTVLPYYCMYNSSFL